MRYQTTANKTLDNLIAQLTKLRETTPGETPVFLSDSRNGCAELFGSVFNSKVSDNEQCGEIEDFEPGTEIVRISMG